MVPRSVVIFACMVNRLLSVEEPIHMLEALHGHCQLTFEIRGAIVQELECLH
jgi:hypothetical protein